MKKNNRIIICLLLSIFMVITIIPSTSYANTNTNIRTYTYLDDDEDWDEDWDDEDWDEDWDDEDWDEDWDDDDWDDDDWDDDDWDDEYWDDEYDFSDINKTFKSVALNKKELNQTVNSLKEGKTNIHKFYISKKSDVTIKFKIKKYAELSYAVCKADGTIVKKGKIYLDEEKVTVKGLKKGNYKLKIKSTYRTSDYNLRAYSSNLTLKKTYNKTIASCNRTTLNPGYGTGKWTTSNKKIVTLASTKKSASKKIIPKKKGTATVTYKNGNIVIKYKIKVTYPKRLPLQSGGFSIDSAGGVEPWFKVSNNSSKKIKYIDFHVTFYNAVGDKAQNDIAFTTDYGQDLRITGPIKPWTQDTFYWNPVHYNYQTHRMYVKKVTITYMDGSTKVDMVEKSFYEK